MSRSSRRFVVLAVATFCGAAALVLAAAAPRPVTASGPLFPTFPCPSNPAFECVMKGLDNPRGLAFFPSEDDPKNVDPENDDRDGWDRDEYGRNSGWHPADGHDHGSDEDALYVAEAGCGGNTSNCQTPVPAAPAGTCFTGQAGGNLGRCYGATGAISRLWKGKQQRVVSGLPSHATRTGQQAQGPHDIAFLAQSRRDHRGPAGSPNCDPACAYVTIGLMQPPGFRDRPGQEFLKNFARLARVSARYLFSRPPVTGKWDYIADLGGYEAANDPDQEFYEPNKLDTNPFGLISDARGRSLVVIDSGGNSMLRVGENGKRSTLAAFAPHPDDSVPTSVAAGPDGAYYVGELTGIPLVPGAANIYRVGRHGEPMAVCLSGFTAIIDIAFDKRGSLYVLQYATIFTPPPPSEGTLIRVVPDRSHDGDLCAQYAAGDRTTVLSGLVQPTSVAAGPDGAVYISNRGTFPATGEVIRFVPPLPAGACSTQADCDDGNVCTTDKCNQRTGTCEYPPIHHRRACDDGNACTSVDVCDRGVCQGSNLPDGTVCSDANACTQTDSCQQGACTGANPVICSPSDQCHVAGTCDTATGACSDPTAPDGTVCDDIDTCSGQDACEVGVCTVPGTLVEKILFSSSRDHDPPGAFPVNSFEVYLMDPDGTNVVRLTNNDSSDLFAALSPDGKGRIVFDSNRNPPADPVNLVDLFLMRSDGSNPQPLGRGSSGSWSPDSRRIAFQRSATDMEPDSLPINPLPGAPARDSDIFVGRLCDLLAGVPPTNITNNGKAKVDVDPDWSNDGQKIVFTSINENDHPQTPTSAEIWTIDPDGNALTRLTFNNVEERAPAWSPDGTRITYMCKQGTLPPHSDNEICVMNADGTNPQQLTDNGLNDGTPTFSPDGQKILFHRGGGGLGTGTHLWVMNLDGTGQTQITFLPGSSQYATWGFVRQRP